MEEGKVHSSTNWGGEKIPLNTPP